MGIHGGKNSEPSESGNKLVVFHASATIGDEGEVTTDLAADGGEGFESADGIVELFDGWVLVGDHLVPEGEQVSDWGNDLGQIDQVFASWMIAHRSIHTGI
jgi:hypothetical protein